MIFTHVTGTVTTSFSLPGANYPFKNPTSRSQELGLTESGAVKAFDHQIHEYLIELNFNCNAAQKASVESFLINTVSFGLATWSFTPDSNVDCGSGSGSAVAVRFWDSQVDPIFNAPGRFNIGMLLRREAT